MSETRQVHRAPNGHSRSALGRLTLLVDEGDGTVTVTYERRWADAEAARRWCEQTVDGVADVTSVLEIQVTEEIWDTGTPGTPRPAATSPRPSSSGSGPAPDA